MSRYTGSKSRVTRRLGNLPAWVRKNSKKKDTPGQHGKPLKVVTNSRNQTEYGRRLREKQKLRYNYGISDTQLFNYVKYAKSYKGMTSLMLLQLLEMRLDSICFALGFGRSLNQVRQLISHGYILVNSKAVNIPSFQCRIKDVIKIKNKARFLRIYAKNPEKFPLIEKKRFPSYLKVEKYKYQATVRNYCKRSDIKLKLNELLVIEYYSRR
uniref:Small ribosomal subunit protein uS4c n=1 Tax=Astrosyne radiata TaxID=1158023 RepID=A0A2U9NT76_9STRA|nr:ribosomal protein S4 [Astrosyne radiata]AWT40343.1 ribosomal protein S4 [Astrosyne radiata]